MRSDSTAISTAAAQELVQHPNGEALDRRTEHRLKRHARVRLEHQRSEEVIDELSICRPDRVILDRVQRRHIDDERLSPLEDDVECRRVLQDEPRIQCRQIRIEGQQGGVAKHWERPLARV